MRRRHQEEKRERRPTHDGPAIATQQRLEKADFVDREETEPSHTAGCGGAQVQMAERCRGLALAAVAVRGGMWDAYVTCGALAGYLSRRGGSRSAGDPDDRDDRQPLLHLADLACRIQETMSDHLSDFDSNSLQTN